MNDHIDPAGGKATDEPVSSDDLDAVLPDKESFNDATLALVRLATDGGERTDLDQAMELFGISRCELEAEIEVGLHDS